MKTIVTWVARVGLIWISVLLPLVSRTADSISPPVRTAEQIQQDWLVQDALRNPAFATPRSDPRQNVHSAWLTLQRGFRLADDLKARGVDVEDTVRILSDTEKRLQALPAEAIDASVQGLYFQARGAVRKLALVNPLVDFDSILLVKRAPGILPHLSDQYYGWWSRPGGGIYILEDFRSDQPRLRCLTADWPEGSFLSPDLSFDGKSIVFAYCRFYPQVSGMEKVDKTRLPEDAFYHLYEMRLEDGGVRQLTRGRYDDIRGRYLPGGGFVFLSTRKGQFVQTTQANSEATLDSTLPDSYVRCGGDNRRPCAIYTLHALDVDGGNLRPLSAFESFEYDPSIANDGRVLYTRWDYIDRFNGHFFSLWSTNPDGTNPQLVYGNYTTRPQAVMEARSVPGSHKILFTGAAHHSVTGGSLVLLDPARGNEGPEPITRLTPEVPFPETETWKDMYYTSPYPLAEEYFLTAWSHRRLPPHWGSTPVTGEQNPPNALGLYLGDAFGNLELLYRDPALSSMDPIPLKPRAMPPARPSYVDWEGPQEGRLLVTDIYRGLEGLAPGSVQRLRVIGVPPKTQPHMNQPFLGVSSEDPGKFVLGTVPVEADGSAYFRIPSGVPVFFQALDAEGMAVQTMRSLTYVQPGQTLSCLGCHEPRQTVPETNAMPLAAAREPSRLTPGPEGSWPWRFDRLVQPVLDAHCVRCHRPGSGVARAEAFDLTPEKSYESLMAYGDQDLRKLAFEKDRSLAGDGPARNSRLLKTVRQTPGHDGLRLDRAAYDRLVTWMDVYAQKLGSFSPEQEAALIEFRHKTAGLFVE